MMWFISPILKFLFPRKGGNNRLFLSATTIATTILSAMVIKMEKDRRRRVADAEKICSVQRRSGRLIVITGCDSGLGLSMAYWAGKLGYKVLAGCLDPYGEGAKFLKSKLGESTITIVGLDVTKPESLVNFRSKCESIIDNSYSLGKRLELWAVVLNAAIGAFGEFLWLTTKQNQDIMNVNFWGSVNLTKEFRKLLLHYKSRLIVISSDCADYPLPGMAIYSASKAALQTWAVSLRREVGKYGVSVVIFQPGSFPMTSRLFSRQNILYREMQTEITAAELGFYGNYFHSLNEYTIKLFCNSKPQVALQPDQNLRKHFVSLLEDDVRFTEILIYSEPFVKLFHFFLRNCPTKFTDSLVKKTLRFPEWKTVESN